MIVTVRHLRDDAADCLLPIGHVQVTQFSTFLRPDKKPCIEETAIGGQRKARETCVTTRTNRN